MTSLSVSQVETTMLCLEIILDLLFSLTVEATSLWSTVNEINTP